MSPLMGEIYVFCVCFWDFYDLVVDDLGLIYVLDDYCKESKWKI